MLALARALGEFAGSLVTSVALLYTVYLLILHKLPSVMDYMCAETSHKEFPWGVVLIGGVCVFNMLRTAWLFSELDPLAEYLQQWLGE